MTNSDVSAVAIEAMRDKYHLTHPELQWVVSDATALAEFQDGTFDCVIDKGTADTLVFRLRNHMVEPTLSAYQASIARVLRQPGGVYIYITSRKVPPLLHRDRSWDVRTQRISKVWLA